MDCNVTDCRGAVRSKAGFVHRYCDIVPADCVGDGYCYELGAMNTKLWLGVALVSVPLMALLWYIAQQIGWQAIVSMGLWISLTFMFVCGLVLIMDHITRR